MKTIIALLALVCFAYALPNLDELEAAWQKFRMSHGKVYDESESLLRKQIFASNRKMILEHNKRYAAGEETFEMAVNQFADLTAQEFTERKLSKMNVEDFVQRRQEAGAMDPEVFDVPASIDWRQKGAVTSVKNQGDCGSCWSFSAAGTLEGRHFLKTGQLISLSEQNLVDCASLAPYTNNGCDGGWPANALTYVVNNGGINSEANYPYEGVQRNCRFNRNKIAATAKSVAYVAPSEAALKTAVANNGPISVAIDADQLQFYHGGVLNTPQCTDSVNHGVVVVGYGSDKNGGDFWLVKNSWGTGWGEGGYVRMARNRNNQCAIASYGTYPNV